MIMPRRAHDVRALDGHPEERTLQRFWAKVVVGCDDECWPWIAAQQHSGHGVFALWEGCNQRAHRLAWTFRHKIPIPKGLVVRHRCDNPPCCNPAHLELGSQQDNIADMHARGRASGGSVPRPGDSNPNAKITQVQAEEIVRRRAAGESITALSTEYGISKAQVSRIASGKRRAAGQPLLDLPKTHTRALAKVSLPVDFVMPEEVRL